jgi:hypothetical protein
MRKVISDIFNMEKVNEINARFKFGSIRLTPGVRIILFLLKLYVTLMGILLVIKFYQILKGGGA